MLTRVWFLILAVGVGIDLKSLCMGHWVGFCAPLKMGCGDRALSFGCPDSCPKYLFSLEHAPI